MELNLADFITIAVLVIISGVLCYVGLWFTLRQTLHSRQTALEEQVGDLTARLEALQAQPSGAVSTPVDDAAQSEKSEVSPETLLLIAAAVTSFLGKKVRIHSARQLASKVKVASPWAQQGRALVQGSHNLRLRG